MGLILRTSSLANSGNSVIVKGSTLSYFEGDGNFMYLLSNMSGSTVNITGSTGILGNLSVIGSSVTFPSLALSAQTHLLSYNTASGQLFYLPTNSFIAGTASYVSSSNVYGPYGFNSIASASYASSSFSSVSASYASSSTFAATASYVSSSNVYGPYGFDSIRSASYASSSLSASYAATASYTPNALITASAASNVITFRKGDNSTFTITIDTGSLNINTSSFASTASFNAFTSSINLFTSSINTFTSSANTSITALNTSASNALITASVSANVITFRKGDNSAFSLTIDTGSVAFNTSSLVTTASFNAYTGSTNAFTSSINAFTSSINSFTSSINAFTGSTNAFTSSINAFTSSINSFTSSINSFTSSTNASITALNTSASRALITASVSANVITFRKGDNSAFSLTIDTGSVTTVNTSGFVTTSSFNAYTGSTNTFTSSMLSFTSSVNTFTSSMNAFTSSMLSFTSSVNAFTSSVNAFTSSINTFTSSANASITNLNTSASRALITASVSANIITFRKGDNSAFSLTIDTGSATTVNTNAFVTTASFNAYTGSTNAFTSSILNFTSSINSFTSSMLSFTSSVNSFTSSVNSFTSSVNAFTSSVNTFTSSANTSITALNTSASRALITASVSANVITFRKGDNSAFSLTIDTGSGIIGFVTTASFNAYTGSTNAFTSSILSFTSSINSFTSSASTSITNLNTSASNLTISASLAIVTASLNGVNVIRFTKGNGNTFEITIDTGSFNTNAFVQNTTFNSYSASMNTFTSSVNAFTSSINTYTSSMNSFTSSTNTSITNLNNFSSSINSFTSSINTFTSSVNTSISNLNSFSSSINTFTSSINLFTSSINSFTSSTNTLIDNLNDFSSSINDFTSSINTSISNLNNFSSSMLSFTSSINAFTSSINTFTSSVNLFTSSVNSFTSSINSFTSSINSFTSSASTSITALNTSASNLVASASLALITASVSSNVIQFTKGNGGTFSITVATGSLGNFITTGSVGGTQIISGTLNILTGSITGSLFGTASFAFSSSYALSASQATTASFVTLQGLGITVNGTNLTASVRQVNGTNPGADGNVSIALSKTITGLSASLSLSSSGAPTASLTDGSIWIISGDTVAFNGLTYIWSSGTRTWYQLPRLDQASANLLYLQLSGGTMAGNITMGSGFTLIGTSSWAANAATASNIQGGANNYIPLWTGSTQLSSSIMYQTGSKIGIGTTAPTTLLHISTSAGATGLTVQGSGSANPLFRVVGSQGELFTITDSLSGSLFAVNNINGDTQLETFSDGRTIIGNYLAPSLYTTATASINTGAATIIYRIPTASYDGAFFDYTARSGSSAKAGQIIAIWSGSEVNYTEITTAHFANASSLTLGVSISGSNMILSGSTTTSGWYVKTIIRSI